MSIQSDINPARDYDTTTTSCSCPSRTKTRPWEPCKHMVRLMVRFAEASQATRIHERVGYDRRSQSDRKDRARRERCELAREREAA